MIGDDLIKDEFIRIHELNMILIDLIDIEYIKILEVSLLLVVKLEIEMKHLIFGKIEVKKILRKD